MELDRGGGGALAPERPRGAREIGTQLKTVYLGGGTPSLLEPEQVDRILRSLDERFGIASDAEITMEMDPGTFDLAKVSLPALRALGSARSAFLLLRRRSRGALPKRSIAGQRPLRMLVICCSH